MPLFALRLTREGLNCSAKSCVKGCSGHGTCAAGGEGVKFCSCDSGYEGAGCESMSCPNSCQGHGFCNGEDGTCGCEPGYVVIVSLILSFALNSLN